MSDEDVYWEFARAELDSKRYGQYLRPELTADVLQAIRTGDRTSMSEPDWDALKIAVWTYRSPILKHIVDRGFEWSYRELLARELPNVLFLQMGSFKVSAPNRTIGELLVSMRSGNPPRDQTWVDNYNSVSRSFDPEAAQGVPILISKDGNAPFLIVEGLTRAMCFWNLQSEAKLVKQSIPILLGKTLQMERLLRLRFA